MKPKNEKNFDIAYQVSIKDRRKILDLEKAQILSTSFWDNDSDEIWND